MGQRAGNTETKLTIISVPMIQVVEELTEGCTINLPQGKSTWTIYMLRFVEDKLHYVNNLKKRLLKNLSKLFRRR